MSHDASHLPAYSLNCAQCGWCTSAHGGTASQILLTMGVSSRHCNAETSWNLGVNSMLDVFCLERLLVQAEVCAVLHEVLRQCWHIAPLEDVPHCTRPVSTADHIKTVCIAHMPGRRSCACHDRLMFQIIADAAKATITHTEGHHRSTNNLHNTYMLQR